VIQGVEDSQLLEIWEQVKKFVNWLPQSITRIWEQLKKFVNWRPQSITRNLGTAEKVHELATADHRITLKLTNAHPHMYLHTISQSLHERFGKENICAKFFPHSLTDNHKGAQRHNVGRLHPNPSDQSALCQLYHYWRPVLKYSVASKNKTPEHRVKNKTITEPRKFCLKSRRSNGR
jgi:hypothetical protein